MDNAVKKKLWITEKNFIMRLDQTAKKYEIEKKRFLNNGLNFMAWQADSAIGIVADLRSSALNVLKAMK
jgi:hypothetical protein